MIGLEDKDIPVGVPSIERLKKLNKIELNNAGIFMWDRKTIDSPEEMVLYYESVIKGRDTSEWFYSSDSVDEIQWKLELIRATEALWKILPEYNID